MSLYAFLLRFGFIFVLILLVGNYAEANYDYSTGRWMQRDPLGVNPGNKQGNYFYPKQQFKNGSNLYEYVKSNPLLFIDPIGLETTGLLTVVCCQKEITKDNLFCENYFLHHTILHTIGFSRFYAA